MPKLEDIQLQIERLPKDGQYIFWTDKEVRHLPNLLEEGEYIRVLTSGYIGRSTWLLLCTDRRIIFLDRGMVYGMKQIQMPLGNIKAIDHRLGLFFGIISIYDGSTRMTIDTIPKKKVRFFVAEAKKAVQDYNQRLADYYQKQQAQAQEQHPQAEQTAPSAYSPAELASHLEKLAGLKERGILSEEEFEAQKARILNS